MRSFNIDFNSADPYLDGKCLGNIGEKNASQLLVIPPAEMTENEKITNYIAAFSTEKGAVRLGPYEKAEQITVPIIGSLTVGYTLAFQLEGYDDEGETVIKSPLLNGFTFEGSVHKCSSCAGGGEDEFAFHFHPNYSVLAALSDKNGVLTYGGESIGQKIKTVELLASESKATAYVDYSAFGSIHFVTNSGISEKATILSVEIKVSGDSLPDSWVEIRNMNDPIQGFVPYISNIHQGFCLIEPNEVCVGSVFFMNETVNEYYNVIKDGGFYGMRVTYFEEGEAE